MIQMTVAFTNGQQYIYATSMPTKWSLLSLIEAARVWVDDHTSWVITELSCVLCSMLIFLHTSVESFCGHPADVMWCDVIITGHSAVNQCDGYVHLALQCYSLHSLHQLSLSSFCRLMCRWCIVQGFRIIQSCKYKVRAQAAWLVNLATTFLLFFTLLLWSNC